jgi:mannose-6-phosphate isomerase-like protein (cupin superfamily)
MNLDWEARSREAREERGVTDYEPHQPFVAERTVDRALWYESQLLVMYADGPAVGNSCCIWEGNVPEGMGPPPHVHIFQHEIFYIIEGHLTAWVEGVRFDVPKNALIFLPAGRAHWFLSAAPVTRMLSLTVTATGLSSTHLQRRLFEYIGKPAEALTMPPAVRDDFRPDPATLAEIAYNDGSKLFDVEEQGWRRAFGYEGEVSSGKGEE